MGESKDLTKYTNPDADPLGAWMSDNLTGLANSTERPNLHYNIIHPDTGASYPPHASRGWIYGKDRMQALIESARILWPKKPTGRPRLKRYQTDMQSAYMGLSTILDAPGNVEATKELSRILGQKVFTFPKPVELVKQLIAQATQAGDLILDFFAGSGSTAQAVHELNQDGGNRRVILVSNTEATVDAPEKNLCRDVCATRVRRVIEGYGDTPGLGGDFAYLRCRRIPAGRLMEIDHPQVWSALQLIHCPVMGEYQDVPILRAGDEDQLLIYLPRFRRADGRSLRKAIRESRAVIIYTWQPELIRQQVSGETHVQVEAVPESLARRFGMKV